MAEKPGNDQASDTAERRHLTVLFCDLVESTGLAERLDPEDLREVFDAYQETCATVVERYHGHIARVVGDGLLIYFGYPRAHEDDPRLAVVAGTEIIKALEPVNTRFRVEFGEQVSVRIGIHTGLVVVGAMGSGEMYQRSAVVGRTPNVAARLQDLADPNTVLVSSSTQRLLGSGVLTEPVGMLTLKGVSEQVQAFKVLSIRDSFSEDREGFSQGDIGLVNRSAEQETLQRRLKQAMQGSGACVAIVGEAGIGKSRLVRAFLDSVRDPGIRTSSYFCSEHHRNVAFYPIIDRTERVFGLQRGKADRERTDALKAELRAIGIDDEDIALIFTTVLAHPAGDTDPQKLEAQEKKRRTRRALLKIVTRSPNDKPMLLIIEDVHWIDPSTLEVLEGLLQVLSNYPILVLITSRTIEPVEHLLERVVDVIPLERLEEEYCRELCVRVAGGRSLSPGTIEQISARSDGVPLYAEELTSAVSEAGATEVGDGDYPIDVTAQRLEVPSSLQGSIMARLDRLGEAKQVAQIAAVQGRIFHGAILSEISELDEKSLARLLDQLVTAGLIMPRRGALGEQYQFKHSLVSDVAYESLLIRRRKEVHLLIARTYEGLFPEIAEAEPDLLAHHYTEANYPEEALRYWQIAGEGSVVRSANLEAIAQFKNALGQLERMPAGRERETAELKLSVAMIGPMVASYGYGAPQVEEIVDRALLLSQVIEDTTRIFPILYTRWSYKQVTGKILEAYKLAQEFLGMADSQGDTAPKILGHRLAGTSLFNIGRPREAREHLESSIELYDPSTHGSLAYVYGTDNRVMSLCYLALLHWVTGKAEEGIARANEAIERAVQMDHANTIGYAMTHAAILFAMKRDVNQVETISKRLLEFAIERELPFWIANARAFGGWILSQHGKSKDALAIFLAGLDFLKRANLVYWRPTYLDWIAQAESDSGDFAAARDFLEQAELIIDEGGERWAASEHWRVKGETELAAGKDNVGLALDYLTRAMDIARGQGARSFELRATVSFARALFELGREDEARSRLEAALAPFAGMPPQEDQRDAQELLG